MWQFVAIILKFRRKQTQTRGKGQRYETKELMMHEQKNTFDTHVPKVALVLTEVSFLIHPIGRGQALNKTDEPLIEGWVHA